MLRPIRLVQRCSRIPSLRQSRSSHQEPLFALHASICSMTSCAHVTVEVLITVAGTEGAGMPAYRVHFTASSLLLPLLAVAGLSVPSIAKAEVQAVIRSAASSVAERTTVKLSKMRKGRGTPSAAYTCVS